MAKAAQVRINDDRVRNLLQQIQGRANNPQIALRVVANRMRDDVLKHFEKEESPSGRWQEVTPAHRRWKIKHKHEKILQNSGNLRRSVIPKVSRMRAIVQAGGSKAGYAAVHNAGIGKMPKREFLWLSKHTLDGIVKYLANYLVRG